MSSASSKLKLWPSVFASKKVLKLKTKTEVRSSLPSGPENECAYIIGDVHGCLSELLDLIEVIKIDSYRSDKVKNTHIVFLGDYIDRGPDSKGVLDFLVAFNPDFATPIYLSGNHEAVFKKILEHDTATLPLWFNHGGRDCARSYGVKNLGAVYHDPSSIFLQFENLVPKEHKNFLDSLKASWVFGSYLCVHAGIKPGRKIRDQSFQDMIWIRDKFLNSKKIHEKIIVHGHSISSSPVFKKNRIGIDTGAYKTGVLSCLKIEGTEYSVLTNLSKQ